MWYGNIIDGLTGYDESSTAGPETYAHMNNGQFETLDDLEVVQIWYIINCWVLGEQHNRYLQGEIMGAEFELCASRFTQIFLFIGVQVEDDDTFCRLALSVYG